ncbi:unnamed protein product, partial [Schistocephalus solidus]|uniref:Integrase catalytic domain-containing protein n=1 Tax=Schistocephalus solidus TaxID=70667 RepID=A0A183TU08_SCHSO
MSRTSGECSCGNPLTGTQLLPVALRNWVLPSGCTPGNRHDRQAKPDNPKSNRPEWRAALVTQELARYKLDISDLSETRFSEQGQLDQSLPEFTKLLGRTHITAMAYHPASNGLVERLHRQLKTSPMFHSDTTAWSDNLPLVLLGIRSAVKEDIQCTTVELVYGTPLRLPGEFVQSSTVYYSFSNAFVQQLKQRMAQTRPTLTRLTSKRVFVQDDLKLAPFVFVRHDAVCKPLCFPNDDPYKVLQRMDKYYVIQKADKTDTVSIDRLKPAYL